MDFDCLTRKELQFLCKRNKIPANITNVAMADALKALEIVEGLDEFKNQSPEKTMTSTRRKPSKEENQAMQSTIRTRKTARKVPETPVTATNTNRRVLKAELGIKDETPLQTGYNTRRSVRLLGKSMTGLSLKENEKVEPVKDDEMVEGEVGNNNGQSELPLVRNLSSSLEDEREKNDDVEEEREHDNETNDDEPEGEDNFTDGIVDSKGSDAIAVSEDAHEIENLKPVADETDDVAVSEDAHEIENLKPVADETDDVAVSEDAHEIENLKPVADEADDVAVSQERYEIENLKPVAVSQEGYEIKNLKEEMVVDKLTEVLVVNAEASADMEVIDAVSVEENANQAPREIKCQESLEEDCEFPKAEEHADDQVSQNVSVLLEGHMDSSAEKRNEESSDDDDDSFLDDSDFDDDTGSDGKSLADAQEEVSSEAPVTMVNEEALVGDDEDDTGNEESDKDDSGLDDDTGSDSESLADAQEEVSSEAPVIMVNKEALVGDDEDDTENEESDEDDDAFIGSEDPNVTEALIGYDEDDTGDEESDEDDDDAFLGDSDIDIEDPNVTEVGTILESSFHNTSQSVVDNGDSEALIDVCVKPAEEFAETAAANSEITTTSLKAQMSQPTQSSSNQVLENINKENIDNNTVKEMDLGLKKVKKNKNLEDLSLRNLKKLLTEQLSKLEITDKDKTNLANIVAEFSEE